MKRTARQLDVVALDFAHALTSGIEQQRMERHRGNAEDVFPLDRAAFGRRRVVGGRLALGEHRGQFAGVDVAHVESDGGFSGNGCDHTGFARHRANGGDTVVVISDLGHGQGETRGSPERIATHRHGHGSGVGGLAAEHETLAFDSLGAGDRADSLAHRLENRPLFDVHFHVGLHVLLTALSAIETIDVDTVLRQDIDQAVAFFVDETGQDLRIDRSHERGRAEQ